ncbi:hypothetical protein BJ170DRAFT_686999 [Xylariales sp. AK1849]|nr:hypothetical protein BJ170DRAFT_686999 [Xylariales sp. AK1849]
MGNPSPTTSELPLAEFHLFPNLPVELRLTIWELEATSPRLLNLFDRRVTFRNREASGQPTCEINVQGQVYRQVSPLFLVKRESRHVAVRVYRFEFLFSHGLQPGGAENRKTLYCCPRAEIDDGVQTPSGVFKTWPYAGLRFDQGANHLIDDVFMPQFLDTGMDYDEFMVYRPSEIPLHGVNLAPPTAEIGLHTNVPLQVSPSDPNYFPSMPLVSKALRFESDSESKDDREDKTWALVPSSWIFKYRPSGAR